MVSLSRTSRFLPSSMRRASHHRLAEHPALSATGILLMVLTIVGIATFLPDFIRYIRMHRM